MGGEGSHNGPLALSSFLLQFMLSGLKKQPAPIGDLINDSVRTWFSRITLAVAFSNNPFGGSVHRRNLISYSEFEKQMCRIHLGQPEFPVTLDLIFSSH